MDELVKGILKDDPILIVSIDDTETVEYARKIHDTYPTATAALGRVITAALLLSFNLKEKQKVMIQIRGEGPLREVVAEADWLSRIRGYVKRPHIHLGLKEGKLDVGRAIGKGMLYVTKDLGLKEPYHSGVPLQTGEIGDDLAYYLLKSEQIPSAVSVGVFVDTDNSVKASGGFMVQVLPGVRDETIDYIEKRMEDIPPVTSMILDGYTPEKILREVAGREVEILERRRPEYYCPCTKDRVLDSIAALGRSDIEELVDKGDDLDVQCWFCKKNYRVSQEELKSLLKD
ncbi:MAG: Hsp33 family molecular chaperone HslO [Nitrospirae bacterium]|nr:Hsp33 family molecular chaperone HslO [Nitrospirota bacterium]